MASLCCSCLWALVCFRAADRLGQMALGAQGESLKSFTLGHLLMCCPVFILGCCGLLTRGTTVCYILALFIVLELQYEGFSFKDRVARIKAIPIHWLLLVVVLISLRLIRGGIPIVNWDSLNHHLPLLTERLASQSWEPLWDVPTDRRTPLLSVLIKMPIFVIDEYGRSLAIHHNLLGLLVGWRLLKALKFHYGLSVQCCFWMGALWLSITDIWLYLTLVGDEVWLLLISALWIEHLLRTDHTNRSWALTIVLMSCGLCIKLTALFFLCPILFMGLWIGRDCKKGLMMGTVCALLINICVHAFTWLPYGMVYPLQRWSDLLAQSSPAVVYDGHDIKLKRESMGLDDHQDNHGAASSPLSMLESNLSRCGKWGTGVLLYWAMVLGPWLILIKGSKGDPFWVRLWIQWFVGLLLTMCLWSFSPQAITRYNIPIWLWAWVLCGHLVTLKSVLIVHTFKVTCSCLVCLSVVLEAKGLAHKLQHEHLLKPMVFWEKQLVDGRLVSVFKSLAQKGDRAFYAGSSSLLWAGDGHVLAQVGNEVGWRDLERMPQFLYSKGIRWLVISDVAMEYDPLIARLIDKLIVEGCIKAEADEEGGSIYRVFDSSALKAGQLTVQDDSISSRSLSRIN